MGGVPGAGALLRSGQSRSAICGWCRPTAASPPRRITHTKAPESDVAWSADSGSIAFATKREGDEVEQIYILNLAEGGEARRLTNISTGATQPAVAPGRQGDLVRVHGLSQRLWTMRPTRKSRPSTRIASTTSGSTSISRFAIGISGWMSASRPSWCSQSSRARRRKDILSASALARTPGFPERKPKPACPSRPLWSPDGREVVFTATTERWNAAFAHVRYHLYRMAAAGGEPSPSSLPGCPAITRRR